LSETETFEDFTKLDYLESEAEKIKEKMTEMFPEAIEMEKAFIKRELQTACKRMDEKVSTEFIIGR